MTDQEIEGMMSKLVNVYETELGAEIRKITQPVWFFNRRNKYF
jgi:hypothetical protein